MIKRLTAALLFLTARKLTSWSAWCTQKSMRLLGFNIAPPPPPEAFDIVGGCLDCGSQFAVKAEFDAHKCPRKR